jgi:hypothetical protein
MNRMKKIFVGTVAAFAIFYAAQSVRSKAQDEAPPNSTKTNITWLGTAVVGVNAPGVIGGPFPQAEKNIEIGLRADGVVVWRKAAKAASEKE